MAGSTRRIAVSNIILTLVMAAFVGVPLAGAVWSHSRGSESRVEKRKLASLPAWPGSFKAWMQFPKAFDAYAHDRFGFRDDLLAGYRQLLASVFHQSASPIAIVGQHGWLYVTNGGALADMQGTSPYTDAELRNDVEQINARGELLAVRGTRYGFVVFPDKHTIYPQFLPQGLYGGLARRRLNALDAAMALTAHDYYFDATKALQLDAKHTPFRLYYKSDTHWNPWGAFSGYRAWQAAHGNQLGLEPFEYRFPQFRMAHRSHRGDLAVMSRVRPHDPDVYPPAGAGCGHIAAWAPSATVMRLVKTIPSHLQTAQCSGTGTALVLHDSFMDSIMPYVSASYARTWYVWTYLDDTAFANLVRILQPDVVIVQRVERLMRYLRPVDFDVLVRELGVIGERVTVKQHGDLVIGEGGNAKARTHGPIAGSLARIVRDGDRVYVEGWARMGESSPAAVLAVVDGRVVGEAPVALYRADVAAARHNPKLTWSGFRMGLPVAALQREGNALQLYFVDFDTYGEFPLGARDREQLRSAIAFGAGMIGKRVTVDASGRLVMGGSGNGIQRTAEPVAGSLDQIVRKGDHVHLEGWARIGGSSPAAVIAVADGRVIGEASVARHRADVAAAYKNPKLAWSGFKMDLPVDTMGSDDEGLSLYYIDSGSYGEYPMSKRDRQRLHDILSRSAR